MGYAMYQLSYDFRILKENMERSLSAIKGLYGKETCGVLNDSSRRHFMFVNDSSQFMNSKSLEDALSVFRWNPEIDDLSGAIFELTFAGENYGNEDLLFETLAPFVETGSQISMVGEDGVIWRWYFKDNKMIKEYGRVVFDEEALLQMKSQDLNNYSWPHKNILD